MPSASSVSPSLRSKALRSQALTRLWVVLAFALLSCAAGSEIVPSPPQTDAAAAFLVQAQSGAVLYEKNAFEARPPASLTKMVTALVVAERCALDDVATVSAHAAATGGSGIDLDEGETIAVGELLKALLLPSANDAAVCLAEHVAGSEAAFADLMNAKAAELGAVNTHFVNPSGLTEEGHYSCARDLAVFGLAVRLQPTLAEIIRQRSAIVRRGGDRREAVANLNRLLARCEGCDGVKTGFTTPAGRCLAASAQRDGYSLLCVVLKSPDSWTEAGALLNWGFAQPPVAVVEVHNPLAVEPVRIPCPIVQSRLHVPVGDFMQALGCTVETVRDSVIAHMGDAKLTFSPTGGLTIQDAEKRSEFAGVVWRGKTAVPASDLCRLLGLALSFDKQTLTARVGPPSAENETEAAIDVRPPLGAHP
ncbi:MAG: D-alanyl-D-alanine carboxypeptidase [Armatimonadetes bacterium]|nr:D-alanyl-D-alanine carboxypeptidase [Armatimonadota bacterium]